MGMPKPGRKGDWIQTSTGRAFFVLDPHPEDVEAVDVAHALACEPRYNGQTPAGPYTVGQHSVLVSLRAEELARAAAFELPTVRDLAFVGLMHDAAEAYCKDIPRPLKRDLPGYEAIERRILRAVFLRFGIDDWLVRDCLPAMITRADNEVLAAEAPVLHPDPPIPWGLRFEPPPTWSRISADVVQPWGFRDTKRIWLERFDELDGHGRAAAFWAARAPAVGAACAL